MNNDILNSLVLFLPLLICVILILLLFVWNLTLRKKIKLEEKKSDHHFSKFKKIFDSSDDAIVIYNSGF